MHATIVYAILKVDISSIDITESGVGIEKGDIMSRVNRIWPFMKVDARAAEEYLEEQSKKGLHIRHIDCYGLIATYEKNIPRNLKYCIDYPNIDRVEEGDAYEQMLKDAGWTLVADLDLYLIFASEDDQTPVPIHTDWREECRVLRKGLCRYEFPLGIIALIVFALTVGIEPGNEAQILNWILSIGLWCICGFGITGLLHSVLYCWNVHCALAKDEPIKIKPAKTAKVWGSLHTILGLGYGAAWYCRFLYTAYTHWLDGEQIAAYSLTSVLVLAAVIFLLKNWLMDHLSEKQYMWITGLLFICMFIGVIVYMLTA